MCLVCTLCAGVQGASPLQLGAAACLAALPRLTGDAAAYSATFRRLLLSLHDALDGAFMGLDDAAAAVAARVLLTNTSVVVVASEGAPGATGIVAGGKEKSKGKDKEGAARATDPLAACVGLLGVPALVGLLPGAGAEVTKAGSVGAARPLASATARVGAPAVLKMAAAAEVALWGAQHLLTGAFPCPVPLPWWVC